MAVSCLAVSCLGLVPKAARVRELPLPNGGVFEGRRAAVAGAAAQWLALLPLAGGPDAAAAASDIAVMPGLAGKDYGKSEMSYDDFIKAPSGLLYKDAKSGNGKTPTRGDRLVVDWSGYTIGYFGRPFETRKLVELDGRDKEYLRFELGAGKLIPALEQGVAGMSEGGVRQIVVPFRPGLGYPEGDSTHEAVGPKPSTFSGQRALNFVLYNRDLIDKTLLFNVKMIRVDRPGENGWKKGAAVGT